MFLITSTRAACTHVAFAASREEAALAVASLGDAELNAVPGHRGAYRVFGATEFDANGNECRVIRDTFYNRAHEDFAIVHMTEYTKEEALNDLRAMYRAIPNIATSHLLINAENMNTYIEAMNADAARRNICEIAAIVKAQ